MKKNKTINVTGMTCGSCESKIENLLLEIDGVGKVRAVRETGLVELELNKEVEDQKLISAINKDPKYQATLSADSETASTGNAKASHSMNHHTTLEPKESLYPLYLIVGYITLTSFLISLASSNFNMEFMMRNFMAGFFLVFSFFKLLDVKGFADSFSSYDILAAKSRKWALAYPYVELLLGVLYLLNIYPVLVNLFTLSIMLIGAYGVLKTLLDKRRIQCACLGTALNLPMTKVTVVEDLLMAGMAFVALLSL